VVAPHPGLPLGWVSVRRRWSYFSSSAVLLGVVAVLLVAPSAAFASGSWVSTSTGCPSGVGTPCYVWESPEGVIVEGGKYLSKTEFETLTPEVADTVLEAEHLSPVAKSYVEDPADVADFEAASANVATDGEGVSVGETLLEGSGEIPILAPLAAFGAGVGIGSKICGWLGIEGCWFSENTEAMPEQHPAGLPWKWQLFKTPPSVAAGAIRLPAYQYYVVTNSGGVVGESVWTGHERTGTFTCSHTEPLPGGTMYLTAVTTSCSGSAPKGGGGSSTVESRSGTAGKRTGFTHSPSSVSGLSEPEKPYCAIGTSPTCTHAPPANWSTELAKNLTEPSRVGLSTSQAAKMAQYVSHQVAGTPLPGEFTTTVPGCEGLSYTECAVKLEEAGLNPSHHELGWHEAVVSDPPERVEELVPARSTQVEKGSSVSVTTNPDEAGMPVVVPAPGPDETYSEYAARLNPALAPHVHVLPETAINPAYGPNAVTGTSPVAGTRVNPAGETSLDVQTNPANAPDATGAPGAGWAPPGLVPIDFSPFAGIHACGVFPFGLFCWVGGVIGEFNVEKQCPGANIPDGWKHEKYEFSVCSWSEAEHWVGYLRAAELFAFTLGLAIIFARATGVIGSGPD
jgi:hypothetical protein